MPFFSFMRMKLFLDNIGYNLYNDCIDYMRGGKLLDNKFDANFYDKPDGTKPAKDFIFDLPLKMRAKILRAIAMLEDNGTDLREPHSKHLDDGIFELRAKVGSNITRVLYFFMIGRQIILTHGFVKKTDKTPPSEISRAKQYRHEYLSREENRNE
jgi:phage-related protein